MATTDRTLTHGFSADRGRLPAQEDTIKTGKVQIERKLFSFALKENPRGRFLRITEDVGGRHDTIIIPAPGLEEFKKLLDEMVQAAADAPASADTPAPAQQP